MTHEYVITLGGRIEPRGRGDGEAIPTALAWAADRVLAVGSDDAVRSISRGDSTFMDVGGCIITPLPDDPARAEALIRAASPRAAPDVDLGALLIDTGSLDPTAVLEPGSPADLAFWETGSESSGSGRAPDLRLIAIVRGGHFSEGDEHRGPFAAAAADGSRSG